MRLATRLTLSFLLVIVIISTVFIVAGVQLIGSRIVAEAQEMVRRDLNAAREIYQNELERINDVVRFTADRFFIRDALLADNLPQVKAELVNVKEREKVDILTLTDQNGVVLFRASNIDQYGDSQSHDELVRAVLNRPEPVAATVIVAAEDLQQESPRLAEQAYFKFIDTPKARVRPETEETRGMMLKAAAPIFDYQNNLIGVLYGGILLNRNFDIVDKTRATVFGESKYGGKDIGTATIFQDDLRISTNVKNPDGSRAVGTRVSAEVYDQVVKGGQPWMGRAYVVNDWYISAYEPIRNIDNEIIGILYVGILEQKYLDIKQRTIVAFLAIALLGALVGLGVAYFMARRISGSINKLVSASQEIARGNLEASVEITSNDELGELAETFNMMAAALQERDEQLKEFTRKKMMESERLALIGQLAAGVAHELNNPLQGIVAYSNLLLERLPCDDAGTDSVKKIVTQANRCRDIIRGLLDFSRQQKPDKRLCNVNSVLEECIALLENQAIFHNIYIEKAFGQDLPLVVMDPAQIERVFMNILINAAEAMAGEGLLSLATRVEPGKDYIEVEFTDTGHGIAEQDIEQIFDPFFTTKEVGRGTGLGLAISYGIIKEHNGSITVESEVGQGTTFTVRLPVAAEERVASNGGQIQDSDHR